MNKKKIIPNTVSYRDYLIKSLRDREDAAVYLKVALEEYEKDKNREAFLLALRTVVEAQGGFTKLAEKTKLNRQNLYRSLSSHGNPRLSTLDSILQALGFRLSIELFDEAA